MNLLKNFHYKQDKRLGRLLNKERIYPKLHNKDVGQLAGAVEYSDCKSSKG